MPYSASLAAAGSGMMPDGMASDPARSDSIAASPHGETEPAAQRNLVAGHRAGARGRRARRDRDNGPREQVTITLDSMAHGGAALGRLDGRVALIDYAIPGEEVRAEIRGAKKDLLQGSAIEVVRAAPARVEPPCPYFGACGGCQWQHIAYDAQVAFKRQVVEEQFRRIGHLDVPVTKTHTAAPWHYRHSAAIALGHVAGFRARGSRWELRIEHCVISHPLISDLLGQLNALIDAGKIANFRGKHWLEVRVVHPDGDAGHPALQAVLKGIAGIEPEGNAEVTTLLREIGALEVVRDLAFRRPRGETVVVKGQPHATVVVGDLPYLVPAGSFFQTNLALLPRLLGRVAELAAPFQGGTVADLYCGAGLFALWLARAGWRGAVVGIEIDALAIEAATATASALGLEAITFMARPVGKALAELDELDLVIVDPPRSGLDDKLLRALVERGPRGFIYVSCEPATLARDLGLLVAGGYTVRSVDVFDFFPQTYHVESLAYLTKD